MRLVSTSEQLTFKWISLGEGFDSWLPSLEGMRGAVSSLGWAPPLLVLPIVEVVLALEGGRGEAVVPDRLQSFGGVEGARVVPPLAPPVVQCVPRHPGERRGPPLGAAFHLKQTPARVVLWVRVHSRDVDVHVRPIVSTTHQAHTQTAHNQRKHHIWYFTAHFYNLTEVSETFLTSQCNQPMFVAENEMLACLLLISINLQTASFLALVSDPITQIALASISAPFAPIATSAMAKY